jgi:hypothetical protein
VSEAFDSDLPPEVRAALLEEVKAELPAFLSARASVQHDPAGDVKELLNLERRDLDRVICTHECLDPSVRELGAQLESGLRNPAVGSTRSTESGQAVRGPIDWAATIANRSLEPGAATYVARPADKLLDVPANRMLAWLLDRLRVSARKALHERVDPEDEGEAAPEKWRDQIRLLARQLARAAGQAKWLQEVQPERPTASGLRRLRGSRDPFYAHTLHRALRLASWLDRRSPEVLADVLCQRYFEPGPTALLFEVCVALRLARAFGEAENSTPREARLLVGAARSGPFARFRLGDGSEVSLTYQSWPHAARASALRELSERHGLKPTAPRPDIVISRGPPSPDSAVIELKASYDSRYLGAGLVQLLAYVADRGRDWGSPAGWLVAPPSDAFEDAPPGAGAAVWIVSSDRVAAAAVERFAPSAD